MLRHNLAEPLLHQVWIFLDRLADRKEDYARLFQLFTESGRHRHTVENGIDRNLLRTLYAGQNLLLAERDTELVIDRLDIGIEIVERTQFHLLGRRGVIIGALIIDLGIADLGPIGLFHGLPETECLKAPFEHPFRLTLLARDKPYGIFGQAFLGKLGLDVCRPAVLIVRRFRRSIASFAILNVEFFAHAISSIRVRLVSEMSARAPRKALLIFGQWGLTEQLWSIAQSGPSMHAVSAIGPSTASTMSATLIAAAGRANCKPPPAPRTDRSKLAPVSLLTTFCTVGAGIPVSAANSPADTRPPPQ